MKIERERGGTNIYKRSLFLLVSSKTDLFVYIKLIQWKNKNKIIVEKVVKNRNVNEEK